MSKAEQAAVAEIRKRACNVHRLGNALHLERFRLKRAIDEYIHDFDRVLEESEGISTILLIAKHKDKQRITVQKNKRAIATKKAAAVTRATPTKKKQLKRK